MTERQRKYQEYLKTPEWRRVSLAVKERAGWKCQLCSFGAELEAHHNTYEHLGDEMNHLEDLVCLCARCHGRFHRKPDSGPEVKVVTKVIYRPAPSFDPSRLTLRARRKLLRDERRARRKESKSGAIEVWGDAEARNDMPEGEGPIQMTRALFNRLKSPRGGFTDASMHAIGITSEMMRQRGWAKYAHRCIVTRDQYFAGLLGRCQFSKNNIKRIMAGEAWIRPDNLEPPP